MLHKLRTRAQDEKGFTLIELLVVILIIGILAAIALPAFLDQRAKAQDTAAKSEARNMVSQMETCYTDNDTYVGCPGAGNGGLDSDAVARSARRRANGYVVTATSKSGNTFIDHEEHDDRRPDAHLHGRPRLDQGRLPHRRSPGRPTGPPR